MEKKIRKAHKVALELSSQADLSVRPTVYAAVFCATLSGCLDLADHDLCERCPTCDKCVVICGHDKIGNDVNSELTAAEDRINIAVNSCKDVTRLGRFAASVDPVRWVEELQCHLEGRNAGGIFGKMDDDVSVNNILDRERAVIESAIVWRECHTDDGARLLAQLTLDVDALLASRQHRLGSSQEAEV